MLASNTNDSLVVLVRYVERDRGRHLLLNEIETILRCFVLCAANIDVEIVLVEAVEYDLDVAYKS